MWNTDHKIHLNTESRRHRGVSRNVHKLLPHPDVSDPPEACSASESERSIKEGDRKRSHGGGGGEMKER